MPADTLTQVARQFLHDHHATVTDPNRARDACLRISEAFAQACRDAGIPATVINGAQFGETPEFPGYTLLLNGHYATHVTTPTADLVYDWTARQFDPTAPVPHITTPNDWHHQWLPPNQWPTSH